MKYKLQILIFSLFFSIFNPLVGGFEVSYSHVDSAGVPLDEKLIQLMNYENGLFIEVGANDGVIQSNTKRLEEFHKWTGILIEPSKNIFPSLCKNRPNSVCFQCALGSFEQNNTYITGDFDGDLMSSIQGSRLNRIAEETVLIRSLQAILDEVGIYHINFFSLDTEGYELNILKGIDFEKVKFDYILIEIYTHSFKEITSYLREKGYVMLKNFSNYSLITNPAWDGTHNDYLFTRSNQ